jgi:hypothetical protein
MSFVDVEDYTDDFNDEYEMVLPSIFKGMSVANLFDIIATDPACPYKGVDDITTAIVKSGEDYAIDIYHRLREEYDYLCSEEMMIDHFEANDYHFTDEGELA